MKGWAGENVRIRGGENYRVKCGKMKALKGRKRYSAWREE